MKIRFFKNFFGKVSFLEILNPNSIINNINDIIDMFNSEYLLTSVVALEQSSEFFNKILESPEDFEIISPLSNTITGETKIISSVKKIRPLLTKLIDSTQRCITFYGFKSCTEHKMMLIRGNKNNKKDNMLIIDNIADFVISIVLEENFIRLSFNKNFFEPTYIFRTIKERLKESNTGDE